MKIMKKAAVVVLAAVLGCSTIPVNVDAANITATVTTNQGKVIAFTEKTDKTAVNTVDAYILSRSKTKASFITTDGTKFSMPVVLDASDKGDLVRISYQGTLKQPRKISIKNQRKAKTIVGTINKEASGMSVIHINSNGKDYSFLKDYTQMNVKGSENEKVKVYYIDQTAVLIETAK